MQIILPLAISERNEGTGGYYNHNTGEIVVIFDLTSISQDLE